MKVLIKVSYNECNMYCELSNYMDWYYFAIVEYDEINDYNDFGIMCMKMKKVHKIIIDELKNRNKDKTIFSVDDLVIEYSIDFQPKGWSL